MICKQCPRSCGVDRDIMSGYCGQSEKMRISRAALHFWEEPCISGTRGSGTVFFTGCGLGCVFCQNYKISRPRSEGREITGSELSDIFSELISNGAHNINLVTPSHFSAAIVNVLSTVKKTLSVPIIWNSSGYENTDTIKSLDGLVDVYLPDVKFFSPLLSKRLCSAEDYFVRAMAAVEEMLRQRGEKNTYGDDGMIKSGVIIRHLVLPAHTHDSVEILTELNKRFSNKVTISLMCQYIPSGRVAESEFSELNRRLKRNEYKRVVDAALAMGFENGFIQEFSSADDCFVPEFNLK